MLRSLYSGISGMQVNQTKMDVIGNNIANVGTTSFKSSNVRFEDMLSQNVKDASGPSLYQGGVNSKQVGLGVQLQSINTVMSQGMLQPTGRALDAAIDGEGFFMVSKGPQTFADGTIKINNGKGQHNIDSQSLSTSGSQIMYSRDGSFTLDADGNLLTSDGYRIMGYAVTNDDNKQQATGLAPGQVSAGGIKFDFSPGSQLNNYKIQFQNGAASGTAISANADVDQHVITISGDFSGKLTNKQFTDAVNKALSGAGISQTATVSGDPVNPGANDDLIKAPSDFNASAAITGGTPIESIGTDGTISFVDGSKKVSAYDDSLKTLKIPDKVKVPGTTNSYLKVKSFSIDKTGIVNATLENGSVAAVGQLALAGFKNPEGLNKLGGNLYGQSANSGEPIIRTGTNTSGGEDNSKGFGSIANGMLEMSNVDLAQQFTDMITTSRAFQASGKMITTGDEILQDIINLKR
ncbi:flagellar hook protein FlgE [Clostridium cavendishii DSM 21758]|uniref:Flagellar hook protein FlgE n=1 Tax=Clostridium cavendishii DSM 21758 TaxID=1121302 RepID=A0A1M6AUE8_9CLOT|nr:flagellar hook-basal body complex protein [Clostridium cavendishii]SHI40149.1 flagellar hook protein FlgE [Clostridium cavendishii DSM 21758]